MAISTNGTVLARLAGALYNTQMSNATYKEVASLDPSALADVLYARDFSASTDAAVATTLVSNLGLASVTGLDNWVAAQLTAAGSHKGAKVVELLNSFAQMTADTTYGAYATAFNSKVDAALALSQTTDNAGGTFAAAGVVVVTGKTFALTSSIDAIVGGSGNDTISATGATFSAGDVITGGDGVDTLNIIDTTGVLSAARVAATVTGVENMEIQTAGRLGQATVAGTAQQVKYAMPASVANVQQVNQLVFGSAYSSDGSATFTYGGVGGSFTVDADVPTTNATNLAAAINNVAGQTVAYRGGTVVANAGTAQAGTTIIFDGALQGGARVGMSVSVASGTGAFPAGTTITAVTATTITVSAAPSTAIADNAVLNVGGGVGGVTVYAPTAGTVAPALAMNVTTGADQSLVTANSDGNVGETVSFTYGTLQGSYLIGADAATTADNFVAALNAVAGATISDEGSFSGAVFTAGTSGTEVAVTAPTAGTALPAITFSGAAANIPVGTVTTANGAASTSSASYSVSGIALNTFKATATDVIALTAKATTSLDLTGTGSITVIGGGGESTMTAGGGAVVVGGTAVANGYTKVTVKGTSSTVDITDKSGLAVDGLTVDTGSTLTTVSVTGNTGLATLTGKGIVDVTMASSAGGLTVANATAGHALGLKVSAVTAGTVTDDVATTIALTSNAAATAAASNTFTGLTAAKVTDVTVAGAKALNLGTITTPKLQTLTISGTGGVTANVASTGDTTTSGYVTKVDTTGSTAVLSAANGTTANNITIGVSTDFAGGAGSDNLTVGASTRALSLGAGTDKLVLTAALYGNSTIGGGTADGGDGTDTLETTFAIAVTAGSSSGVINDKISNFEKLSITAGTLTDVVTVDFDYLSKINSYVKLGAFTGTSSDTLTLANLANNATIEMTGAFGANSALVASIKDSGPRTTDVLNLKLASSDALLAAGSVTANGIETINITSTNSVTATLPASRLDTLTLAADAVKTIVISGAAGLNLTNTNTTVTSVDASGITGTTTQPNAFTWTAGALTNTAKTATVIGTAAGINTINLDSISDGLMATTITVGGSSNVSANVFTGGAGLDTVTGGSGNDSFTMMEGRDTITTGSGIDKVTLGAYAVDRDVVTDFTAGVASGSTDKVIVANYVASTDYFAVTTAASSYEVDVAGSGSVIEFAIAGNSGVNLGDNSANSLTGTNLLKALYNGETAATLAVATGDADTSVTYIVAYQSGNAYVYLVGSDGTTSSTGIGAAEIALVGVLNNVAVGALTADNFAAS